VGELDGDFLAQNVRETEAGEVSGQSQATGFDIGLFERPKTEESVRLFDGGERLQLGKFLGSEKPLGDVEVFASPNGFHIDSDFPDRADRTGDHARRVREIELERAACSRL